MTNIEWYGVMFNILHYCVHLILASFSFLCVEIARTIACVFRRSCWHWHNYEGKFTFMILYGYNVYIGFVNFSCSNPLHTRNFTPTFWTHWNWFHNLPFFPQKFLETTFPMLPRALSWLLENAHKFEKHPLSAKRVILLFIIYLLFFIL